MRGGSIWVSRGRVRGTVNAPLFSHFSPSVDSFHPERMWDDTFETVLLRSEGIDV